MLMGGLLNVLSIQVITMGLLAKAYAYTSGLREDAFVEWLYRRLTFEKTMLVAVPLAATGLWLALRVVLRWIVVGYGDLDEARPLFFGVLCLVNGVQIASASYLFSIMALPRHVEHSPVDPRPGPPSAA